MHALWGRPQLSPGWANEVLPVRYRQMFRNAYRIGIKQDVSSVRHEYPRHRWFGLDGFAISYRVSGDYDMFARAVGNAQFRRLARPVGCFRQTGLNNSGTNMPRTRVENARICTKLGPSRSWSGRC
jgi:hypothetical protein